MTGKHEIILVFRIALKKAKELQEKLEKKQCAIEEEQIIKQVLEMEKKAKVNFVSA